MRRFRLAAGIYAALCLAAVAVILLRGDGPHPRIVSIYPTPGDRYWPGGSAEIAFSQSMDQSSVVRALQVSPGGEGQAVWYGNILNLQPVGDWKPGTTYRVSLVGSVTDDLGRPLVTPVSFSFRVHHIGRLGFCNWRGVRNVCEVAPAHRLLTRLARPVRAFALAPDGSMVAFTAADRSGLSHLFLIQADGTGLQQLTFGPSYVDSDPTWPVGTGSITYHRRPVIRNGGTTRLGPSQLWNINTDGSHNSPI